MPIDTLLSKDYLRVVLKDATVEAHVGLHPWEKHPERPTRLRISVDLFVPLQQPGPIADAKIVDYDRIRQFIRSLSSRPHTDLLETLVDEIVTCCFEDARVLACRVEVLKPDIFNEANGAGVEIFRTREGWSGS
jgi:dihydroneopterin aldolase